MTKSSLLFFLLLTSSNVCPELGAGLKTTKMLKAGNTIPSLPCILARHWTIVCLVSMSFFYVIIAYLTTLQGTQGEQERKTS